MSQRGSLRHGALLTKPTSLWAHIRGVFGFSLALTLGTTLTLTAQDSPAPKLVTLDVAGNSRQVYTYKETVQTLLHQEFLSLGPNDRCEPPIDSEIQNEMTVTITRVSCEKVTRRIPIPAPTITRWDARLSNNPITLRNGRPGVAVETSVVWKKNGVVSESWVQSTKVIRRPRPTIVLRGNLASRSGLSVRRVMTMVATAYDPGPLSCGPHATGRTAMGLIATKGVIAVDPRVIPLGTRVFVDGYGPAIAADTGGAIHGNRIDVCFDSRREALRWGRRTVNVMIME